MANHGERMMMVMDVALASLLRFIVLEEEMMNPDSPNAEG